jgi:hypothetical protein
VIGGDGGIGEAKASRKTGTATTASRINSALKPTSFLAEIFRPILVSVAVVNP